MITLELDKSTNMLLINDDPRIHFIGCVCQCAEDTKLTSRIALGLPTLFKVWHDFLCFGDTLSINSLTRLNKLINEELADGLGLAAFYLHTAHYNFNGDTLTIRFERDRFPAERTIVGSESYNTSTIDAINRLCELSQIACPYVELLRIPSISQERALV